MKRGAENFSGSSANAKKERLDDYGKAAVQNNRNRQTASTDSTESRNLYETGKYKIRVTLKGLWICGCMPPTILQMGGACLFELSVLYFSFYTFRTNRTKFVRESNLVLHCTFAGMPDTLICGGCRFVTSDFEDFREHRKSACPINPVDGLFSL